MSLLLALAVAMPELGEVERFPPLPVVNAGLGFLVEQRYFLKGQIALNMGDPRWRQALIANDHALRCWESLLEARGGLADEEGGSDDEHTCRAALNRLRALLGDRDWAAGMMP